MMRVQEWCTSLSIVVITSRVTLILFRKSLFMPNILKCFLYSNTSRSYIKVFDSLGVEFFSQGEKLGFNFILLHAICTLFSTICRVHCLCLSVYYFDVFVKNQIGVAANIYVSIPLSYASAFLSQCHAVLRTMAL